MSHLLLYIYTHTYMVMVVHTCYPTTQKVPETGENQSLRQAGAKALDLI
jgi:hypothetical protein